MKTLIKGAFCAASAFAATGPAWAQAQDDATGSVQIIQPLSITNTAGLDFGRVTLPATTATVTIGSGADSVNVTGATAAGGTPSRAKFTINGEPNSDVSLTRPANFDLVHGVDPGATIPVTLSYDLTTTPTLDGSGAALLNVGGSFDLASTTMAGAYSGTFNVSVDYQ